MKMKMDALHYALLAVVVLLAVYCASRFLRSVREGNVHKGKKKSDKYFTYNRFGPFVGEQVRET